MHHDLFDHSSTVLSSNRRSLRFRRSQDIPGQSLAHYIDLYEHAPVGYLTLNDEGLIQEINFTAANLLGKDHSYFIGQPFVKFINESVKEVWLKHFQLARQSDGKYGCELPFLQNNGTSLYYHLDCYYKDTGTSHSQMRITLTDVTQRKRSEDTLRIAAVAFEAHEGIIVTDPNKVILSVNKAFSHITGYESEEVVGKTPTILSSGVHNSDFYRALWALIEQDGYWQGEIWDKRKNGELFPIWQTITVVRNKEGKITHFVSSFTDITIKKQAEKALLDAKEELLQRVVTSEEELHLIKQQSGEINTALGVMLKHRELDKTETQIALSQEVEATVLPLLSNLKGVSRGRLQSTKLISILEANLQQLVKSYGRSANLAAAYQKLTPIERQVASMVRQGLPTKVIAAALNIASGTVDIHRKHIRKKLGLNGKDSNLHSYLVSLSD
jgi:PAS domain S-box-containing protein